MKQINWNPEKNRKLMTECGISFEKVVFSFQVGGLLDDIEHPIADKYAQQQVLLVAIDVYVYLLPYVETDAEIFLKTIILSRKATKLYLGGNP